MLHNKFANIGLTFPAVLYTRIWQTSRASCLSSSKCVITRFLLGVAVSSALVWPQVPLGDALRKRVEYEFHSAGYHTMVAVVTGLKTVVGHLVKVRLIELW